MEQLTFLEAKRLQEEYQFLTSSNIKNYPVKAVVYTQHEKNENAFKVVVCVETDNPSKDDIYDLDNFCQKFNLPTPSL